MEIKTPSLVSEKDFVRRDGLDEQQKREYEGIAEFFFARAYEHSAYLRRYPHSVDMFFDVMRWHRNVVVTNKYAHATVDYDVYINDASWEVAHIILTKALTAVAPIEIYPPPVRITNQVVAIESPYKVFMAKNPLFSGYLAGEGIAKVLHKLWIYFTQHAHRYRSNVRWQVETTAKQNNDLVAEVRIVEGLR